MRLQLAPTTVFAEARNKGLARSLRLGLNILRTQASARVNRADRQFVFISSTFDNTGAPYVLSEIIGDFVKRVPPRQLHVVAPTITPDVLQRLKVVGVRIDQVAATNGRLAGLQLGLRRDDFVLMNTAAVRDCYQDVVLSSLEADQLSHAFWFIHEDPAQLGRVAPRFLNAAFRRQVARLIETRRLTLLVPSEQMGRRYRRLFEVTSVTTIPLRVSVAAEYTHERTAGEYGAIHFLISGTPWDGRKGHFVALAAFSEFMTTYLRPSPDSYRPFSLSLLGLGDDPVSRQLHVAGKHILGDRLTIFPHESREGALAITRRCNAVICCSLNEAFGLYVAEGMAMGHVVLRNDSCGAEEQLADGINGFWLDSNDVGQMAAALNTVLNKAAVSDSELQAMGRASQRMISPYKDHEYFQPLADIQREHA